MGLFIAKCLVIIYHLIYPKCEFAVTLDNSLSFKNVEFSSNWDDSTILNNWEYLNNWDYKFSQNHHLLNLPYVVADFCRYKRK